MRDNAVSSTFELDPDGLKTAEFLQADLLVNALVGKTIAAATTGTGQTSISTTDGTTLMFCGFAGVLPAPVKP